MLPVKSEEGRSYGKAVLAGVKQCHLNLFGDINQMLPIHLRALPPALMELQQAQVELAVLGAV